MTVRPALRDTWVVMAKALNSDSTRKMNLLADTPEQALALFADTVPGRSGNWELTSLTAGESIYVEATEDNSSNDD